MSGYLTPTEVDIVRVLYAERGRFVTPAELFGAIAGYGASHQPDALIKTHIHNIRSKGIAIVNRRGIGYALAAPPPVIPEELQPARAYVEGHHRTVRCGRCGTKESFGAQSVRDVRDRIRSSGWERRLTDEERMWVCPPCISDFEAERREQQARRLAEWRARNLQRGVTA